MVVPFQGRVRGSHPAGALPLEPQLHGARGQRLPAPAKRQGLDVSELAECALGEAKRALGGLGV